MSTTITRKLISREATASCLLGFRLSGAGVSGAEAMRPFSLAVLSTRERGTERPVQAPAVAAAQADAYALIGAAKGADNEQKQSQHHTMWAFRGLEPWRDPA